MSEFAKIPLVSQCEYHNKETNFVFKKWGHEFWIVNKEKYCGKLLCINKGHRCSWHYHNNKDETFFVMQGDFEIVYGDTDDISEAKRVILHKNDTFYVPTGLRHTMLALTDDAILVEISTQHFDEDSVRVIEGY